MPELNLHWTDDEDLLARFVLNRVEAAERQRLEAHLGSCEQCRRAVEAEQLLAAGIKKAGREELKARLRERMVPRKKIEVTWYQVAGAAAAIVVLVSIGLYNRWFISSEREQAPLALQHELEKVETPADQSKTVEKDKGEAASPASGAGTARPRAGGKGIAVEVPQVSVEDESNRAVQPMVAPLQIAAAPAGKEAEALHKGTLEATTVWVEGTVLSRGGVEDRAVPPAEKKGEQLHARRMEEPAPTLQQQALVRTKEPAGFIITQLPASDLPESRQQERQRSNSIQTLLGRTGQKLHLTIFLDTLVNDTELHDARIVPISEDSIILNLGSQRIGFKIPPGWSQESLKQTGKKQ